MPGQINAKIPNNIATRPRAATHIQFRLKLSSMTVIGIAPSTPGSLRKDCFPVLLHAHNGPTSCFGFIERLVEAADGGLAVVGPFTLGVGVMDQAGKARAATGDRPLEHLEVAVGIAE